MTECTSPPYTYAHGDLLKTPNSYQYTPFEGPAFLEAWRAHRRSTLDALPGPAAPPSPQHVSVPDPRTDLLIDYLVRQLREHDAVSFLDALLQRFEVTKRIYDRYALGPRMRRTPDATFSNLSLYIRAGELFDLVYQRTEDVRYLSALLKIVDTITAHVDALATPLQGRAARLVAREVGHVDALPAEAVSTGNLPVPLSRQESDVRSHRMDGVLFLASQTARSRVYAKAFEQAGLHPDHVLIFGADQQLAGQLPPRFDLLEGTRPARLSESVVETCRRAGWSHSVHQAEHVNGLHDALAAARPDLVIYSGFGGQIVSSSLLEIAPFLHAHPGRVPDQRGSTVLHYNLLEGGACAVSAILLAPHIDAGPLVGRGLFRRPSADIDIDFVYDNLIRADVLIEVLRSRATTGSFPIYQEQYAETGRYYYIIHPVLKHLALLRR